MVNSTEYWQFIDFTSNIVLPPDCWDNCSLQYRSAHCIQHSWTLGGSDNGYYPVPDSSVCGSSVMTSKDVDIIERCKKRFYFAMNYGYGMVEIGLRMVMERTVLIYCVGI